MIATIRRRALAIAYTHDPSSAVAVGLALVLIPVRMWTIYTGASTGLYQSYPIWLQAWVAACLIGQLAAEVVGHLSMRRGLTVYVILAALASACVQAVAALEQGGWVLWLWVAIVEGWVYYRLSIVAHVRARSDCHVAR